MPQENHKTGEKGRRTPTIHNQACYGDIAPVVLMPGDPVRAEHIACRYLDGARLVSNVRRICVYTGSYRGRPVSVMASGMGAGSMGIYSHELYDCYGVEQIIRVGSAGGLSPQLSLGDVVIGLASSTDSGYADHLKLPGTLAPCADFGLINRTVAAARELSVPVKVGMLFSGAAFHYGQDVFEAWRDMGALAVEMESAALYTNAARLGKKAVALCTISDMIFTEEHLSPEEREVSFGNMIHMALEAAVSQEIDGRV